MNTTSERPSRAGSAESSAESDRAGSAEPLSNFREARFGQFDEKIVIFCVKCKFFQLNQFFFCQPIKWSLKNSFLSTIC